MTWTRRLPSSASPRSDAVTPSDAATMSLIDVRNRISLCRLSIPPPPKSLDEATEETQRSKQSVTRAEGMMEVVVSHV